MILNADKNVNRLKKIGAHGCDRSCFELKIISVLRKILQCTSSFWYVYFFLMAKSKKFISSTPFGFSQGTTN